MAIDSADKRRASIGFGMPQSSGTLIPSGATSAFRRGSALGLYHIESAAVTDPNSGWTATTRTRLAIATDRTRVAISASKERVWIAEGK